LFSMRRVAGNESRQRFNAIAGRDLEGV